MQSNLAKSLEKIFSAFDKIDKPAKAIIKYGAIVFLALFALGTLLVVLNHTGGKYDPYSEFIATSIIKSSFTILAEAVIGGLLMDYIFKK